LASPWVLFAPLLHQALNALGDGEPALLLTVAGTIIVREDVWPRREELRLLKRLDA
jgi:hypothetical protein